MEVSFVKIVVLNVVISVVVVASQSEIKGKDSFLKDHAVLSVTLVCEVSGKHQGPVL
jgi:hypothetical protein